MSDLVPLPFEIPADRDSWISAWATLRTFPTWKSCTARAARKHTMQELIAYEVSTYHDSIRAELERYGLELLPSEDLSDTPVPTFACNQCSATFPTAQQLAVHAFRLHGQRAQESYYVQSAVCAGCLRNFHTSFRVLQHLRHRPNQCWSRLSGVRPRDTPITVTVPSHLEGVHRLPAIRQHHGPLRPTAHQRECRRVRLAIADLQIEGDKDFAWWDPTQEPELLSGSLHTFETTLARWFRLDTPDVEHFHNMFFAVLFDIPVHEYQAARIFIYWIETSFYDTIQQYVTHDAYPILDQAHMSLLEDLHIWVIRQRMDQLQSYWSSLQQGEPKAPRPAGDLPSTPRPPRVHAIASGFVSMAKDERDRRAWRILHRPQRVLTPGQGPYFVLHLYSGRRRENDFHDHMQRILDNGPSHVRTSVIVLSIDTAIHQDMDVHSQRLWGFLLSTARAGKILALLLGPPCETWSVARFAQVLNADGLPVRGPRPVRGDDQCWCLPSLSISELEQVNVGNCLLLRGIWLSIPVALQGGAVILEHPAPAMELDKPSIWRTGVVRLLLRGGQLFRRFTFKQGNFGAMGIKPTTVMYANTALPDLMHQHAQPISPHCSELIGKDNDGKYKTMRAKEYPSHLCWCFAQTFWHSSSSRIPEGPLDVVSDWVSQFAAAGSRVEPAAQLLPDYQPKR